MDKNVEIISVRENPEYKDIAVEYISSRWSEVPRIVYADCIEECLYTSRPLPQWYILMCDGQAIGCVGLTTNDFISRADLWPWAVALYIDEQHRGNAYGKLLLERCAEDAAAAGFRDLYLSTDHVGLYEKYGFLYIGEGYGTSGEGIHIYRLDMKANENADGITVRPEREEEFPAIHGLIKTAFETARVKDGDEQDFAAGLRRQDCYIPELALVAEDGAGNIVGHIMLTRTCVELPGGGRYEGLLVAPLSVLLEWRDKGVGSLLMEEAMRRARGMGWKALFLCGDPAYYHRFGFRSIERFGINTRRDIPLRYVMAAEIVPGGLEGITGMVDFC